MTLHAYFLALLFLPLLTMAQTNSGDSMITHQFSAKDDTARVKKLLLLANEVQNNEPIKAAGYAKQAETLSRKLTYNKGIFASLTSEGQTFYIRGLYDTCIYFYNLSLDIAIKMNDQEKIGMAYINIGGAYREQGNFEKALEYFLKGQKILDKTSDESLKAQTDDAVQILYFTRAEFDKAILFGDRALSYARKSGDQMLLARCLINLSINYISKNRQREAEAMLNESLAIAKSAKDIRIEATALMNLADLAIKNGDAVKIRNYCNQSLQLSRQVGALDNQALALRAIAISFLMEARADSANTYAQQAYTIDTANRFRRETLEVLDLLSHINFASGKIKQGFDYNRRFASGFELFVGDMVKQQSAELEKKYETEKKQGQINHLQSQTLLQQLSIEQKSTLNYILAGGAIALLTILLLSIYNFKNKQRLQQQRINTLETENQLTATEAVLKGEEQERTRLAKDLHDGLGGMLSGIKFSFNTMKGNLIMTPENKQAFERSMDMLDSSIQEMRRVAHNMMPEALLKFGLDTALKDLCNDINQTGALHVTYQSIGMEGHAIDQTTSITIYRIVQELLNNTMKHAAASNSILQLSKTDNKLTITVEDDGKGFDVACLKMAKGIGWSNIINRIEFLKGRYDINSHASEGTSVLIEINV